MNAWTRRLRDLTLAIHRRLLPDDPEIGWTPYLWLVYLGFVYLPLALGEYSQQQVATVMLATVIFLVLYFYGYWTRGNRVLPSLVGIAALGVVVATFNFGASAFFIYAAAFACQLGSVRKGIIAIGAIVATIIVEWWLLELHIAFLLPAVLFSILIGTINLHYAEQARRRRDLRLSHAEVQRLAATAERERIARDLHDLLGHTLSLITLKAQLSRRLIRRDQARAESELEELERISRSALEEVRDAVVGFRSAELNSELANARLALDVAGIGFDYQVDAPGLTPEADHVLAMCVREAVTNVIRHANARRCWARLQQRADRVELVITDDGRSSAFDEGSGLKGMRERLAGVGGALVISTGKRTQLRLRVPLQARMRENGVENQVA